MLDSVEFDQLGTRIRFSGGQEFVGHRSSELIKECDGQHVSNIARRKLKVAFEIEFGSAGPIAKSLASLKHAFDLGAQRLFLILPSDRVARAQERLSGAFHEIAEAISVLPIDRMIRLSPIELAENIGIDLPSRRGVVGRKGV